MQKLQHKERTNQLQKAHLALLKLPISNKIRFPQSLLKPTPCQINKSVAVSLLKPEIKIKRNHRYPKGYPKLLREKKIAKTQIIKRFSCQNPAVLAR